MGSCFKCKKCINESLHIDCCLCKNTFHASCVKLTSTEIEFLTEHQDKWTCLLCLSNTRLTRSASASGVASQLSQRASPKTDVQDSLPPTEQILEMFKSISSELSEIKQNQIASGMQIAECISRLEKQSKDISENRTLITSCQTEVNLLSERHNDLDSKISSLTSRIDSIETDRQSPSDPGSSRDVTATQLETAEIVERVNRASNILVYNVPENDDDLQQPDIDKVRDILNVVDRSTTQKIISIQRLHPRNERASSTESSNSRPIKVTFVNPGVARAVMRQKHILSSTQFKRVSISDDKTPKQIRELQDLRRELRKRVSDGETNLTIKYRNGTPGIVKTSPKN